MTIRILRFLLLSSVTALIACGGGGGSSTPTQSNGTPPSGTSTVTVQLMDDFYSPKNIQVQPGDTVRWVMAGQHSGHSVTDSGGAFDSGFVFTSTGASFSHTFTTGDSGKTFNYLCRTHGACCGMKGSVQVGSGSPPPSPGY